MSRLFCIVLAALMVTGCFRSEVREARRERAPLREVFPPPSLEQAAPAPVAAPAPSQDGAETTAAASSGQTRSESVEGAEPEPGAASLESEFSEARPVVEEAQQAAADTAALDVAAAAAADTAGGGTDAVQESTPAGAGDSDRTGAAAPPGAAAGQPDPAPAPAPAAAPAGAVVQPVPAPEARTPPRIVVSTRPAILVPLYGKPRFVNVPGTALTRIENTPAIVLKGKSGNYYVPVYDGFMQSKRLDGTWSVTRPVPKVLLTGKAAALKAGQQDLFAARPNPRTGRTPALASGAPRVIVSSQPTALVLVDGQPGYQRVAGTQLSRLVNSDAVMLRNAADGRLYLQVGDRWYRAASTSGPWSVVPAGELPADIGTALEATR